MMMLVPLSLVSALVLAPPRAAPAVQARRASAPVMLDIPRIELPSAVRHLRRNVDPSSLRPPRVTLLRQTASPRAILGLSGSVSAVWPVRSVWPCHAMRMRFGSSLRGVAGRRTAQGVRPRRPCLLTNFTHACARLQVGAQLKEFDLKDPNQLSDAEYNTYSAAAIGGTLALMLPGAHSSTLYSLWPCTTRQQYVSPCHRAPSGQARCCST